MKKFSPLFLLLCFVVFVSSCSKEEEILIEPPVTPINTEDQEAWELTYDPLDISTEQEFFEEGGVTDSDQVTEEGAIDSPTTSVTIGVGRTPLGTKNTPTTIEGETTTTTKIFTRSE